MQIKKIVLEEAERLEKEIAQIEKLLKRAPEGGLSIFHSRGQTKMYQRIYRNGKIRKRYLTKEDLDEAKRLAWKHYYKLRLVDAKEELRAIQAFLRIFMRKPNYGKYLNADRLDAFLRNQDLMKLIGREDLIEWANAPYEKLEKYPENLTFVCADGVRTRSKSEGMIRETLQRYGIPFRYDCGIEVAGEKIYVDFLIRHPVTGEIYILEHWGMMDDPFYREKQAWKMDKFLKAGYAPGINLIITSETKKQPLTSYEIDAVIRHFFL